MYMYCLPRVRDWLLRRYRMTENIYQKLRHPPLLIDGRTVICKGTGTYQLYRPNPMQSSGVGMYRSRVRSLRMLMLALRVQ